MSGALRVLIAEDEPVIGRRIARLVTEILGPALGSIEVADTLEGAGESIAASSPHLLILDLNLHGDDGFRLVCELSAAGAFDTIVVSAHRERALEAFDYGVRDFVAKPFGRERLERALRRVLTPSMRGERAIAHLGVRRDGAIHFITIDRVLYIRASGVRSELVLTDGLTLRHDKMLDQLEGVLPSRFARIHRSFIVDLDRAERLESREGSRYELTLRNGVRLPVGRTRVSALRTRLGRG